MLADKQTQLTLGLSEHLTHKANRKQTRYGWLRLTPSHSVHLVADVLNTYPTQNQYVLDPFCGTGTTALVCAERGVAAETTDINPFLVWLSSVKTRQYATNDVVDFAKRAEQISVAVQCEQPESVWTPPLHQIEKWWNASMLQLLGQAYCLIEQQTSEISPPTADLLRITFCRTMIETAHVSFAHQSMSFRQPAEAGTAEAEKQTFMETWGRGSVDIARAACSPILRRPGASLQDARELTQRFPSNSFDRIITSPPYPNRMSYIRELRPYMYWLGYLHDGKSAGEMDWQAIGGTWGCATSNLSRWTLPPDLAIPFENFETITNRIAESSSLLARYVEKYFVDMTRHIDEVFAVIRSGGTAHYIVGNSKFYDVVLPVEQIFAALFRAAGFQNVTVQTIRKRTSKKELFEYLVAAQKP